MGSIRIMAVGMAVYLLAVTILAIVARSTRAVRLTRLVDHVTLPLVQRLVVGAVGAMAGPLSLVTPGWALPDPTPPGVPVHAVQAMVSATGRSDDPPTLRRLTVPPPVPVPVPIPPVPVLAPVPAAPPPPTATTWTVRPGHHVWLIASSALQSVRHRQPTTSRSLSSSALVIEENRHSLPDPSNPDLLFVGMHIVVPAIY